MHRNSKAASFAPWDALSFSYLSICAQEASWMAGKEKDCRTSSANPWMADDAVGGTHSVNVHHHERPRNYKSIEGHDKVTRAMNKEKLRARRCRLEYDVMRLQMKLQEELELREAYESSHDNAIEALAHIPAHLPAAQKLVLDVATLEFAVSKLEQQMASLQWQILEERSQHENYQDIMRLLDHEDPECLPSSSLPHSDCSCPSSTWSQKTALRASPEPPSPDRVCQGHRAQVFMSSSSSTELPNSAIESRALGSAHLSEDEISEEGLQPEVTGLVRPWGAETHCDETGDGMLLQRECTQLQLSQPPPDEHANRLSEEMVHCMMDIYQHLSGRGLNRLSSTTSHLDSRSVPASSFMSFARSPLVDLRTRRGTTGCNAAFDPYATKDKLCWPEPGPYDAAVEVCSLCVGKEELEYAAEALQRFKSLVEQLPAANPCAMSHSQKLAFWINIYNALMMHAYLAYGTPKNESKCYSLMQKATYTIGGHCVNAMAIERILKARPTAATQRALGRAKHKDQKELGLSRAEPLVSFSLSFGARSCPAVRIYTPTGVQEQLLTSMEDYLQASVGVTDRGNLLVPRLIYSHARDVCGSTNVGEWVFEQLSDSQQTFVRSNKHKLGITVVPFDSSFRYLFLTDHC